MQAGAAQFEADYNLNPNWSRDNGIVLGIRLGLLNVGESIAAAILNPVGTVEAAISGAQETVANARRQSGGDLKLGLGLAAAEFSGLNGIADWQEGRTIEGQELTELEAEERLGAGLIQFVGTTGITLSGVGFLTRQGLFARVGNRTVELTKTTGRVPDPPANNPSSNNPPASNHTLEFFAEERRRQRQDPVYGWGANRDKAPTLPEAIPAPINIPGVGSPAVTPPHFGMGKGVAGKHPALMIDGKVYVHHQHLAAQELAGTRPKPTDLYGFVDLDANGNVIPAHWVEGGK